MGDDLLLPYRHDAAIVSGALQYEREDIERELRRRGFDDMKAKLVVDAMQQFSRLVYNHSIIISAHELGLEEAKVTPSDKASKV